MRTDAQFLDRTHSIPLHLNVCGIASLYVHIFTLLSHFSITFLHDNILPMLRSLLYNFLSHKMFAYIFFILPPIGKIKNN